jgi:hypothetical protein
MIKEKNILIEEDRVSISISLEYKYSPKQKAMAIDGGVARLLILEKHPGLKLSEKPEKDILLRNKDRDNLSFTWTFKIEREEKPKSQQKKLKKEKSYKNFNDTAEQSDLTFSEKGATMEETTDLRLADKGVEEPME